MMGKRYEIDPVENTGELVVAQAIVAVSPAAEFAPAFGTGMFATSLAPKIGVTICGPDNSLTALFNKDEARRIVSRLNALVDDHTVGGEAN